MPVLQAWWSSAQAAQTVLWPACSKEGSAEPRAPGKERVGSRLGLGSSFILCRTFWQAAGG